MFSNRKIRKIFTVLVAIMMMGITFGLIFSITSLITGKELSIIAYHGPGDLMIRAIFFGIIALGAFVFEKETQSRYAGIIGTLLSTIGFAVSIFVN